MRIPGLLDVDGGKQRIGFSCRGHDALWAMPPADQAAVLPAIFTCNPGGGQLMMEGLVVGFGGEATIARPRRAAESIPVTEP